MADTITCDICGFTAKNKMSLLGHLKKHNPKRNATQRNATQNATGNAELNAVLNAERNAIETEAERNGNGNVTSFETQRNVTQRNVTQRNENDVITNSERSGNDVSNATQRNETQRNATETQRNVTETETERNENGTQNATAFIGQGTHQNIDPQVLNMIEYQLGEKVNLNRKPQQQPQPEVVYYEQPNQNAPQAQQGGNSKVLEYIGLSVANLAQELIKSRMMPKQGPSIFEELGRESFGSFLASFSKSRGTAMGKTLPKNNGEEETDPYEQMNAKIANTLGKYFEEQDKKFKQLTEYNEKLLKLNEKKSEEEAENAKVDEQTTEEEHKEEQPADEHS